MIQDQLPAIIKRFKENEYYQSAANKENDYRRQHTQTEQTSPKQDVLGTNKKVKYLQSIIEKMMIDGNKMHRYYEQMICESAMQFETFKEEYNGYRCSISEQKKEGDVMDWLNQNLIEYLNSKIETLNRQISNKEELYRDLLQKYEALEEHATNTHLEESEHVKDIQKQLVKQSMHHEQERKLNSDEIEEMKKQYEEAMEANEQLLNQNNYLKNMNQSLAHSIEYLKRRLYVEENVDKQEDHEEDRLSLIELERCDVDSISREDDKFSLEQIKMNDSQEINFNGQKQVLNLSQHYSKFNRTEQFHSKEKSSYDFVVCQSNERQSFAKRKETVFDNRKLLVKIDSIQSKSEEPMIKSKHITEIKEFKMSEPPSEIQFIDPYKAFFVLLTQCEKMNSPYFQRISHIDLSYLYPKFIQDYVPYNKWQEAIRCELENKLKRK